MKNKERIKVARSSQRMTHPLLLLLIQKDLLRLVPGIILFQIKIERKSWFSQPTWRNISALRKGLCSNYSKNESLLALFRIEAPEDWFYIILLFWILYLYRKQEWTCFLSKDSSTLTGGRFSASCFSPLTQDWLLHRQYPCLLSWPCLFLPSSATVSTGSRWQWSEIPAVPPTSPSRIELSPEVGFATQEAGLLYSSPDFGLR